MGKCVEVRECKDVERRELEAVRYDESVSLMGPSEVSTSLGN